MTPKEHEKDPSTNSTAGSSPAAGGPEIDGAQQVQPGLYVVNASGSIFFANVVLKSAGAEQEKGSPGGD